MKIFIIIFTVVILFYSKVNSQSSNDSDNITESISEVEVDSIVTGKIGLIARAYSDSVILRWFYDKNSVGLSGEKDGYIVEKAIINSDGSVSEYKKISDKPIKPWTKDQWSENLKNSINTIDTNQKKFEESAFELLYPKDGSSNVSIETYKDELDEISQIRGDQGWKFLFTLISASRSRNAAEGLGLGFTDRDVKAGETYSYRIYLAVEIPIIIVDTGYIEVKAINLNIEDLKHSLITKENDGSIGLEWERPGDNVGFYVEKSDNDGKSFKLISNYPQLILESKGSDSSNVDLYLDTNVRNYKPYIYRVYSLTNFADEEFIGEIKAMGRDKTPPGKPFLPNPENVPMDEVNLKWKMNEPIANDLAGFYVGRDTSVYGKFENITSSMLSKNTFEYTDKNFLKDAPNFYIVKAVDTAGNISFSSTGYVSLKDTTPPVKPIWISGKMDSNGVVTLILKPNSEKDLMGYRILSSNSTEHEFSSLIESFGDDTIDYTKFTEFKDTVTLETTTRFVYYTSTALDQNYNESPLSEIIAVPRPDIIPPVSPVITDITVTDKLVNLTFAPSSSEDVKYHAAFRRLEGEEKWDSIAVLNFNDSTYTDKNIKQNVMYEYTFIAVDSSGLRSEYSFPVNGRPYDTGVRPGISDLKATYDEVSKSVKLSWRYEGLNEEFSYCIYRGYKEKGFTKYSFIEKSSAREFTDNKFSYGKGNYTYAIKVFAKDGGESKLSDPVKILIK